MNYEYYRTPEWCIRAIPLNDDERYALDYGYSLDPACGDGVILHTLGAGSPVGIDLDPRHGAPTHDFLAEPWIADIIVMNPPYSLAVQFVQHALKCAPRVLALLRLGFLASMRRAEFHRAHPSDVYILSKRPSFTGGGSDHSEYAWFCWGPDRGGRWSVV
jgi:hypothetical protein